jgi:tRNA threonylcarbamoyladenosine biosynthesis protein TsaB
MTKKQTTLYIDTSSNQETVVKITQAGKTQDYTEKTNAHTRSQNLLPLIATALKSEGLTLTDLTQIKVHPGPGSFTGTRVGVSVANALSWALGIPVNHKKIALPQYTSSKFDA